MSGFIPFPSTGRLPVPSPPATTPAPAAPMAQVSGRSQPANVGAMGALAQSGFIPFPSTGILPVPVASARAPAPTPQVSMADILKGFPVPMDIDIHDDPMDVDDAPVPMDVDDAGSDGAVLWQWQWLVFHLTDIANEHVLFDIFWKFRARVRDPYFVCDMARAAETFLGKRVTWY